MLNDNFEMMRQYRKAYKAVMFIAATSGRVI